jgi:uncharacterized damage-inducible protein DinB
MYDHAQHLATWDHFRQVHGMTLRVLDLVPADKIDSHPVQNMRSPKELIVHLYGTIVRDITEGVVSGAIKAEDDEATLARIRTKADLVRFVTESWTAADKAAGAITDAALQASVKTPWGFDMPGAVCLSVTRDEYFHHRGQLYAYVRQMGGAPPMMWDFEHNAPEFQPRERQTA